MDPCIFARCRTSLACILGTDKTPDGVDASRWLLPSPGLTKPSLDPPPGASGATALARRVQPFDRVGMRGAAQPIGRFHRMPCARACPMLAATPLHSLAVQAMDEWISAWVAGCGCLHLAAGARFPRDAQQAAIKGGYAPRGIVVRRARACPSAFPSAFPGVEGIFVPAQIFANTGKEIGVETRQRWP